jgi:putative FmdB family regulatory protein
VPTYEYRCKGCGADLEVVQAFTDDPLTTCETCGGPLRKVFGSVGISFKGSGFYKTDSRSGASTKATAGSGGDSSGTDSSTSGGATETPKGDTSTSPTSPTSPTSGTNGSSTTGDKAKAAT